MSDADIRDFYGRVVRDAWIEWAKQQPIQKRSWLVPYEELSESDKEADRRIAEAVLSTLYDPPEWVKRSIYNRRRDADEGWEA